MASAVSGNAPSLLVRLSWALLLVMTGIVFVHTFHDDAGMEPAGALPCAEAEAAGSCEEQGPNGEYEVTNPSNDLDFYRHAGPSCRGAATLLHTEWIPVGPDKPPRSRA